MFKRLHIYLKEMLPPIKLILASVILFFEIYFLVILISDVPSFNIGLQEIIGCITIFTFLLSLRIADDFKDYKTDLKLFSHRPLPSGRVKKSDLITLLVFINAVTITLNLLFMNNLIYYGIMMTYGILMSVWFFARTKIQTNLPLALVTHNPIQLIMNMYIITFTCIKYNLPLLSFNTILIAFTLYWPGLLWEISRKTRAPEDETEYTTYSKLFGLNKVARFILLVMFFDVVTSSMLMWKLWNWGVILVVAAYLWLLWSCFKFIKNPKIFPLVSRVEIYELITEVPVILVAAGVIMTRWVL